MSVASKSVEISLDAEERELLEKAIATIRIMSIKAEIPKNTTNGDVIKALFPKAWKSNYIDSDNKCTLYSDDYELEVDIDWWNAPWRGHKNAD